MTMGVVETAAAAVETGAEEMAAETAEGMEEATAGGKAEIAGME